jgi:hypothetical protein
MANQNEGSDPNIANESGVEQEVKIDDTINPDEATPEQVKELIKTAQTAIAQKKHWRDKAVDPETGKPYKDLFKAQPHTNPPAAATLEAEGRIKKLELAEEKRQFGYLNNLAPEETDHVFAYAQGNGIKPSDALARPFIKTAIEAMRQEAKIGNATPGPSSKAPMVEGKSFSEMKDDDKRANFGKFVNALQSRKR